MPYGARGLEPIGSLMGSPWNSQVWRCLIPATDTNDMFIGDPVDLAGSASADGFYPTVLRAAAGSGNPILGVIVGFEPDYSDLSLMYRKGSTARYCLVCVDPYVIYRIKAEPTNVIPSTSVGLNAVLYAGTGNTMTGYSGWQMDSGATTAPAVNSQYQLLILRAAILPDNDISSAGALWDVVISLHRLNSVYTNAFYGLRGVS